MKRRRDMRAELREQIDAATADTATARDAVEAAQSRGTAVESMVQTIRERRERDPFGRAIQITLTPRRRA